MSRFVLSDEAARAKFEDGIRSLVEGGNAARAQALLHEAAKANGFEELAKINDPFAFETAIEGWDHALTDCDANLASANGPIRLDLRLVARTLASPDADQGLIQRACADEGDVHVAIAHDVHCHGSQPG